MEALVGALASGVVALFGYLLHHFVQSHKTKLEALQAENTLQGKVLVTLENDLNEAWFHIRQLRGVGGGRRKCRITARWGDQHVSRYRSLAAEGALDESAVEGAGDWRLEGEGEDD